MSGKGGKKKLSGRIGQKFGHIEDAAFGAGSSAGTGKKAKGKNKGGAAGAGKFTVAELIAKGQAFLDKLEPELALQFYKR